MLVATTELLVRNTMTMPDGATLSLLHQPGFDLLHCCAPLKASEVW